MNLALSSVLSHVDLFAASAKEGAHGALTSEDGDCGTVVPHHIPGGNPPPPPPPLSIAQLVSNLLHEPSHLADEGWCGTAPHKLPFPPPPPPTPWIQDAMPGPGQAGL